MSTDEKKPPGSFRDYFGGVHPLRSGKSRVPPVKPPPERDARRRGPSLGGDVVFERRDDGFTMEGARAGAERRLRDLKRSKLRVNDSLDLHGMTAGEAERALEGFFERQRGPGERTVLVVHGRGSHSPGGRGVLRDEMARWLATAPLAEHVLCFATARPEDGGSGAVYVVLASRR
jgi:DNA-nicking Smr family endonuclease